MSVRAVMHFVDEPAVAAAWWAARFGGRMRVDDGFAWFERGGVEVGFHPADGARNPVSASTVTYWATGDLEAERRRLLDAGCTPWRGPLDIAGGRRTCQLRDPFGIVFGLDSGGAGAVGRTRVQKVLAYVVRAGRLLVFTHRDRELVETGVQVPAGTVRPGEDPEAAVMRELVEESGRDAFRVVRHLGTVEYDVSPYREEVQVRHCFQVAGEDGLPDTWLGVEHHDGRQPPTALRFSWIPLESGHVLAAGQGALLHALE